MAGGAARTAVKHEHRPAEMHVAPGSQAASEREAVEISAVIPVFRGTVTLRELHRRLSDVLAGLAASYEIVLVDDGSDDDTWAMISELSRNDGHVHGLRFSRNFGQHAAITAGLANSRGRWVVVMDADLQDPPEEIPRFYEAAQGGADIVFGRRVLKTQSALRRLAGRAYFRLLSWVSGSNLNGEFGSYSMLARPVVEAFLRFIDRDRHYILILAWLGFRVAVVDYRQSERHAGQSSYDLRKLIRHAVAGVMFQTARLLHWLIVVGFVIAALGVLLAGYFVLQYLFGTVQPGWTSLIVVNLIVGGLVIGSIGLVGLYVGRIFDQVRERPLYVVQQTTEDAATSQDRAGEAMARTG